MCNNVYICVCIPVERKRGDRGEGNLMEEKRINDKVNGAKCKELVDPKKKIEGVLHTVVAVAMTVLTRNSRSSHNFLVQTQK